MSPIETRRTFLGVPVSGWEQKNKGDVLYQVPDPKVDLTRQYMVIEKVVVGEDDSLEIRFFVVGIPCETVVRDRYGIKNFRLRGHQLRIR